MAELFFDPSALVKRYIFETGTSWVERQTNRRAGNKLLMSALAGPEMIATLVRRARSDRQLAQQLPRLRFLFRLDWAASYSVVDVDTTAIAESMRLAERHGLRGADAVHLAAAMLQERRRRADGAPPMTFISADQEQLAAATLEGLLVEDPNQHRGAE